MGLSSIGTSISVVLTRSRTESVIPRLRRRWDSAAVLRSAVEGPVPVTVRRVVIAVVIDSCPSYYLSLLFVD